MSPRIFDCVVIGSGPAGLAAARAAAEDGLSTVTIDRMGPGGQLMNLGVLQGLPDLEPQTMGPDLIARLTEEAMEAGVELAIDDVQGVSRERAGGPWLVEALEESFEATSLIIASGLKPGTTGLEAEAAYDGQGLSHCASCDAPLYRGRPVVVAGDDAWAVEEAVELNQHASQVTFVSTGPLQAPPDRLALLTGNPNVSFLEGRITGLDGDGALAQVIITADDGRRHTVEAHGLFLMTGRVPARDFIGPGGEATDGLFWAGDVRQATGQSIAEAIADGAGAGHNAAAWVKDRQSRQV